MSFDSGLDTPSPSRPVCVDLWWAVPGVLAGISMPYVHPLRYEAGTADLTEFEDELPVLWDAGIRGVVGLLNLPSAPALYRSDGFDYCWLPMVDGGIPTRDQFTQFLDFMQQQVRSRHPVVAHCVAGLGRTGVLLAAYLVAQGQDPRPAVRQIRAVRPGAVETSRQMDFLYLVQQWRESGELPR